MTADAAFGLPFSPRPGVLLGFAVAAAAASLWLLLPRGRAGRLSRAVGILVGIASLSGFAAAGHRMGSLGEEFVFLTVATVAIVSAAATILTRSPVYSAIWFALALAGISGVLLVLGAQFLGVATIVVYAGAILVMFLFVLMLAQPSGLTPSDRISNEPLLSAIAGAVLVGLLTLSIGRLSAGSEDAAAGPAAAVEVADLSVDHVARLGGELFGRHLIAVEAAGVLLLVALIGAIAVVSRGEAAAVAEGRPAR